jgi:hypothetical protein
MIHKIVQNYKVVLNQIDELFSIQITNKKKEQTIL